MIDFEYIDSTAKLKICCETWRQCEFITLDTEFVRTKTYTPQLGLLQVYDGKKIALIDPISMADLSVFAAILTDENIIKVVHSCSEDLDAIWYSMSVTPAPIFDTQVAANILGMGQTIGYANLVETMLGIQLDKGESRTDWLARPLSKEQCNYAAADVLYLHQVYIPIRQQIDNIHHTDIVFDEISWLAEKRRSTLPHEWAYLSLKNNWKLGAHGREALKHLAAWRLEQAQRRDMAINFVIREQSLIEVATKLPENKHKLFSLEVLTPKEARLHQDVLMDAVEKATHTDPEDCPPKIQRLVDFKEYKSAMAELKRICDVIAKEQNLAVEVLASKKQLNQWLKWCWFMVDETEATGLKPDIIQSWRRSLFIDRLLPIFNDKNGKFNALRGI